ncbi:hypothetical protein CBOM_04067 [Ceraceosorus bombacis]|uniref:Uncharacterized protein n=1 Tax=Ceraceosorus bombacis TaxID=401625 RepID=A0A0P1BNQ3_9BASI|nr:hypothetical protein CBOM_04067 [Ceraceosorus bombacis]
MAPSQMQASSGNDASRPSRSVSLSGPSKGAGLSTRPRGGSNASRSGPPRLLSSPSGSTLATGSGQPSSQHPLLRAPSRSSIVDHTHATNASLTLHMPERDITAAPPPVIEEETFSPAGSRINGRSMQQRSVVRGEGKRAESEGASLGKRDKAAVREELRSISSRKSPRAEAAASPRSTSGFLSMKRMFGRSKSTSVSNGTRTDPSRGSATAQSRPEGLPEESSEFGGLSDDHKSKGNSGSTRTSRDSSRSLNSRGLFSSFRSRDSPRRNKMELSAAENNGQRSTRVGSEAAPAAAYAARATLSPAMEAPLRNGGRRSLDSVTSSHVGQADKEGFARSTTPTFANTGVHAAGPSRSLTLQALSSASTSPYGSLTSEQAKYPNRAQTSFSDALLSRQSTPVGVMQRDASAYSASTDEGMGIALTAGSSTDLLTNSHDAQASRDPRPAVPKMWQLSRTSRNLGDMEDSEEQPEETRTAALAFSDSHGEGSRIDAHSRFTTMTSIASYRTATSGYADPRRGDLSTIADTSRGDSTGSRGVASNTAPSTQDSAAISDLITNLQRGERSPNIALFSSSAERGHAAPAIAAGPSPTPQLTPASSEREETMRRISDETSFDSPSVDSAHRRRNTFGGGPEAAATGPRTERSARDSSQRDLQEIESDLAAVERALQDHSIAGSFDPSSLRRRIGPPNHTETSVSLRSLIREGAPEDASDASFAGRVTLPPGSELAIANAVRDCLRIWSLQSMLNYEDARAISRPRLGVQTQNPLNAALPPETSVS